MTIGPILAASLVISACAAEDSLLVYCGAGMRGPRDEIANGGMMASSTAQHSH